MNDVINTAAVGHYTEGVFVHHTGECVSIHVEGVDTFTYTHMHTDPRSLTTMLKGKVVRVYTNERLGVNTIDAMGAC